MKATIRITAQYYENYNTDTVTPHYWKPKGGHEFTLEVDADDIFYIDNLEEVLKKMVAEESDDYQKFEYIEHDVTCQEPTKLSTDKFEKILMTQRVVDKF